MIRRALLNDANDALLITQHDHAVLAAQLARQINPKLLTSPLSANALLAIEQHDCGWPLHDDAPTLNANGQPLDVFEAPLTVALKSWKASVDRVEPIDAYAAFLISLHVFSLSLRLASAVASNGASSVIAPGETLTAARARFLLNQFQHREIERHEQLRRTLAMPTNLPLQHGLATNSDDPRERALTDNFMLLQAMDALSLDVCCTSPPVPSFDLSRNARGRSVTLSVRRLDSDHLAIEPWPFVSPRVDVEVPTRRVSAHYSAINALQTDFANAVVESLPQAFFR